MHEHTSTYELGLVGGEQPLNAHVVVTVRDWTEHGLRNRPCTVVITWAEQSLEITSDSVYHAFQEARARLERSGLTPDCYGSCPEVQTSGMLCDMGDGTMAYRMGGVAGSEGPPTVNIFDWEPGLKLGTVAEQKAYVFVERGTEPVRDRSGAFARWSASWIDSIRSVIAHVRSAIGRQAGVRPPSPSTAVDPGDISQSRGMIDTTQEEIVRTLVVDPLNLSLTDPGKRVPAPDPRIDVLVAMVFDLLMEVEALRAAQLASNSGARGTDSVYGRAYRDTAYLTHNACGPSSGLDKLLGLFYGKQRTWRECLMLLRLGFSQEQVRAYEKDAARAETFT